MKLIELKNIFHIGYGNSFDLKTLDICNKSAENKVNYVSRTRENNGVSAFVKRLTETIPFKKGLITVAGSGNSVLESFVQPREFYTGYHVFILRPKVEMPILEKLFYCFCIKQNQYKYSFGRQANKTLKSLLVPETIPDNFTKYSIESFTPPSPKTLESKGVELCISDWKWFNVIDLFDIGSSRDELISKHTKGGTTPYISSSEFNNGITSHVIAKPTNRKNTITANRGGSVGHFFYQEDDYLATPVDVRILKAKFKLNKYIGLFLTTILQQEKFKFNYSRKMGTDRLKKMSIKLPANNEKPDWKYMEKYIKSLPYSASL